MLKGITCLVTGGTSGLGKAVVQRVLASQGNVTYVGRSEKVG